MPPLEHNQGKQHQTPHQNAKSLAMKWAWGVLSDSHKPLPGHVGFWFPCSFAISILGNLGIFSVCCLQLLKAFTACFLRVDQLFSPGSKGRQ
eukprot:6132946-Amphidinium_carterae.1